jgi:hypothetical protein
VKRAGVHDLTFDDRHSSTRWKLIIVERRLYSTPTPTPTPDRSRLRFAVLSENSRIQPSRAMHHRTAASLTGHIGTTYRPCERARFARCRPQARNRPSVALVRCLLSESCSSWRMSACRSK